MAHDDIWDDSALVASWNEALDEYKVRRNENFRPTHPMCFGATSHI